jgi:hypothetical protein
MGRLGMSLIGLAGMGGFAPPEPPSPMGLTKVPEVAKPAPGFTPQFQQWRDQSGYAEMARTFEALLGKTSTLLGPTNPRWSTFTGEMKPEVINGAIERCNQGYPFQLCDMFRRAVENDTHLQGVIPYAFAPILASRERIEPMETLARDQLAISSANWLRSVREQVEDFDGTRYALLWGEGQSFASVENIYAIRRVIWYTADGKRISREYCIPVQHEIVDGRSFQFDTVSDEPLLWLQGDYATLPPAKFIFHKAHGFTSIRERRGFMRSCLFLHAIKQWCVRDLATYLHVYGIPQTIMEYAKDFEYQYPEAMAVAKRLAAIYGQAGIPTVPMGQVNVRHVGPPPEGALVHTEAASWLNTEMTIAVTSSGPLTLQDGGGSYGLGGVHAAGGLPPQQVRANNLCGSIRRDLWNPTYQLNQYRLADDLGMPPADIMATIPRYSIQLEREPDMEKRQRVFSLAMQDGCPVSRIQYRAALQLDPPRDDEDVLKGKATPIPSSGALVSSVDGSDGVVAPMPNGVGATSVSPLEDGAATLALGAGNASQDAVAGGTVDLTATAQSAVIRVDEARAKLGLPAWGGADGQLSVAEFMAKHSGTIAKATDAEDGDADNKKTDGREPAKVAA